MLKIKDNVDLKYKIGNCVEFNGISGIIDNINVQNNYIQYGIEMYYYDEYHLGGWNWIGEDEIKSLVNENKKTKMLNDYIECADKHIAKGYPKSRFKLYDLIKADLVEKID